VVVGGDGGLDRVLFELAGHERLAARASLPRSPYPDLGGVDRQGLTSVPGVLGGRQRQRPRRPGNHFGNGRSTAGAVINNDLIIGDMTARMLARLQDAEPPEVISDRLVVSGVTGR
jgi:hypothetical protein